MRRFIVRLSVENGIKQEWIHDQLRGHAHTINGTERYDCGRTGLGVHRNEYDAVDWRHIVEWMNERAKTLTRSSVSDKTISGGHQNGTTHVD